MQETILYSPQVEKSVLKVYQFKTITKYRETFFYLEGREVLEFIYELDEFVYVTVCVFEQNTYVAIGKGKRIRFKPYLERGKLPILIEETPSIRVSQEEYWDTPCGCAARRPSHTFTFSANQLEDGRNALF